MSNMYTPVGFPNSLFVCPTTDRFFIAKNIIEAKKKANSEVKPVYVADMIRDWGHKETHELFKSFHPYWMTKGGLVYFP